MSIYVLRSDNLVKIGFSDDLRTRVGAIIAAIPVPVEFVGHMPGDRDVERHLHERFAQWRFSGEWFVETPEMRVAFDLLLTPRLPEILTERGSKRQAEAEEMRLLSERVRTATASRWPDKSVGERIDALAGDLGWNRGRAKDLYYYHPKMALRAFEKDEIERSFALWLAPELKGE